MNDFKEYKAAFLEQNDLAHFGILGMRWGVRRYQNKDGSLTPAGQRRYNENEKFANKVNADKKYQQYQESENKRKEVAKRDNDIANFDKVMSGEGFKRDKYGEFEKENDDGSSIRFSTDDIDGNLNCLYEYRDFKKSKKEHDEILKREYISQLKAYRDDYVRDARKRGYHNEQAIQDNVKYFNDMIKNVKDKPYSYWFDGKGHVTAFFDDGVDDIFVPNVFYDIKKKQGRLAMDD